MENSNLFANIIVFIVILHFVAGFGYLLFKLSPKKGDGQDQIEQE